MAPSNDLIALIAQHEGVVDHLYLDTEGNVTCGVGYLVRTARDLTMFAWTDLARAREDFVGLQALADVQRREPKSAAYFAKLTGARMLRPLENLPGILLRHSIQLRKLGLDVSTLPDGAQNAVHDMAYQLGPSGLVNGFPKFVRAVLAGNWDEAAKESRVRQASAGRNTVRAALLRSCAEGA